MRCYPFGLAMFEHMDIATYQYCPRCENPHDNNKFCTKPDTDRISLFAPSRRVTSMG
jgi:hypothetical protein